MEYGQVRCVSEDVVVDRVSELTRNPLAVKLRLTVHHDTGIFPFFARILMALVAWDWTGLRGMERDE